MVDPLTIAPTQISQFGPSEGVTFCLVTNPEMIDAVQVVRDGSYRDYITIPFQAGDRFEDILAERIPEPAHILVMSPGCFFESPPSELLGRRKLLAMACNSTPTSIESLRHFLGVISATSAAAQEAFSDRFFELAEASDCLIYADDRHGTKAILDHLDEDLVWNQQAGYVDWGEQQIVPSGEISVLPAEIREFDQALCLPLEGEITLRGFPILHSGTPSFTREDQSRIHSRLYPMHDEAIIAKVVKGRIVDMHPYQESGASVARMLEALFEVDSRYQHVWEIGHALNTSLDLVPGNHAMNEVYGADHGCLHWGLGLTPYTQYHLDIIAPDTTVYNDSGQVLLGERGGNPPARLAQVPGFGHLQTVFS